MKIKFFNFVLVNALLFISFLSVLFADEVELNKIKPKLSIGDQLDSRYKITGKLNSDKIAPCQAFTVQFFTKNISDKPVPFIFDSNDVLSENLFFQVHPLSSQEIDRQKILLRNFHNNIMWFLLRRKRQTIKTNEYKIYSFKKLTNIYDFTLDGEYIFFLKLPIRYDEKLEKEIVAISDNVKLKIDSSIIDLSKVISSDLPRTFTKPLHGISFSLVSDNLRYDNYGPVYFQIGTKNVSDNPVSMIVDTKNILDVYDLVLLTPGDNLDFRNPAKKDKSDVQKVEYTLYGQKLVSEKSKTPKPLVSVKPNEETAESVFVLNRIFDMSTDGIYGLIVTRKIIDSIGKEQTISNEPFPIRIGQSLTQDEIDERVQQRRLEGNDPDYPIWRSSDGLFKVIAKFISVDKDVVTLEKIDGKKITFNVSDLTKENQDYIKNKKNPVIE